jgi:hypothetical protein
MRERGGALVFAKVIGGPLCSLLLWHQPLAAHCLCPGDSLSLEV